jgi:uncharacterized protein YbdZ (MbtH family)
MGGGRNQRRAPRRPSGNFNRRRGGGSLNFVIAAVVITLVLVFISALASGSSDIPSSTIRRESLSASAANTNAPSLIDDLGWISNQGLLQRGLNDFHSETGVWPTLYITDTIAGTAHSVTHLRNNRAIVDTYMSAHFEAIDNNQGNMLVLVFDDGDDWDVWMQMGAGAITVMDSEAQNILISYIERHWHDTSISTETLFSRAFSNTGERIMQITRPWWYVPLIILLVGGAVIVGALIAQRFWAKKKAQANLEHEQTMAILNTDLSTAPSDADRLARQYDDE